MLQAEQKTFWVILHWNRKQCFDSPGSPLLTVIAGQILDSTGFCRSRFICHLCSIATCNAVIAIYGDSLLSVIFSSLCSFWSKPHSMMPKETSSYLFAVLQMSGDKKQTNKKGLLMYETVHEVPVPFVLSVFHHSLFFLLCMYACRHIFASFCNSENFTSTRVFPLTLSQKFPLSYDWAPQPLYACQEDVKITSFQFHVSSQWRGKCLFISLYLNFKCKTLTCAKIKTDPT